MDILFAMLLSLLLAGCFLYLLFRAIAHHAYYDGETKEERKLLDAREHAPAGKLARR